MQQAILITGAFDLLHAGHINLLKTAKALADACGGFVVCLINSDAMVRGSKGPDRPRQSAYERQDQILSLGIFGENDFVEIMESEKELEDDCWCYQPIRLLGSDYIGKPITGAEFCKLILFINRTHESTTKTIQSLSNR